MALHEHSPQPWRKLVDYERLLCYCSAIYIRENYVNIPAVPVCGLYCIAAEKEGYMSMCGGYLKSAEMK